MANKSMNQIIATFILIVLALALTPAVGSFVTDAGYTEYTEYQLITSGTSNSTEALTYEARNDSATYAYFTISIVAGGTGEESEYGLAAIEVATNITYTEATQIIEFKSGVFDSSKTYNMSLGYYTEDLTSSVVLVLLPIVPILWVVAVLAVGIASITVLLKRRG